MYAFTRVTVRGRAEDGSALPVVLLALVVVFALASVTVMGSVNSQQGTTRDQNTKAALAEASSRPVNREPKCARPTV